MEINEMQFQLSGSQKLTDWKNEPSILALKNDLEAARSSHDSQLTRIRKWTDLLKVEGTAKPVQIKGRSSVQPKLIRRQAEWRYPALSEPFLSSDKLFKISPVTFEDEKAARQNELVLNYQFRTKLDRVKFIDDFVRATVDEGTCITRLGWCRYTTKVTSLVPVYSYFPLSSADEVMQFQQALEMSLADPRTFAEQADPAVKAAVEYYKETNQATIAQQTGEQEIEEDRIVDNRPTVEILNPANVYIDPTCNGDFDKALFAVVSFETNKAELLKEGDRYKNLDLVNWESNTPLAQPDHATNTPQEFGFKDTARKKVVAYEYWGFYDIEGNGVLRPIVVTWIGDTIIRMELNPFPDEKLPFVVVPYLPVKRDLYGEPDAEMLEDNQKILGAVTRGMIDLMGRSANGQKGFPKGALDPLNRKRYENGQDYEFNPNIPNGGLIEHKFPELPMSAMQMLQLQNQEAEALTGVKAFSGGLSGDAYGNVATGIRGMLDAAAKREMSILRRLAKGVSEIGKKICAMNAEFLSETEQVRITNEEFVKINREDLKGNFDLMVDISTFEVDNTKAQDLGFMLQTLGPNMDPTLYTTMLAEIAELKRMPALAEKLRNWRPPPPDPVQQQMAQLELMKTQLEVEKLKSEVQLNMAKAHQAIAAGNMTELERVQEETGTNHARKLIEAGAQSRGNQNAEVTKALLKPLKDGEKAPDVAAAIGFNALSDAQNDEKLR